MSESTQKPSDMDRPQHHDATSEAASVTEEKAYVNTSGHPQELHQMFDRRSVIAISITTGNHWIALAGTIAVAVFNGGPTGIIYEFIASSMLYWFIAASLAEMASSIPSSAGVYHWATVAGGRFVGFMAGWWNFFGWILATAVTLQIIGIIILTMAQLNNAAFEPQRWQVFVIYLFAGLIMGAVVYFCNKFLPRLEQLGGVLIIAGFFITLVVVAAMPAAQGRPYASSRQVWATYTNLTGYTSTGFSFLLGMLNGSFAVGIPDLATHLSEETKEYVLDSLNAPCSMLT